MARRTHMNRGDSTPLRLRPIGWALSMAFASLFFVAAMLDRAGFGQLEEAGWPKLFSPQPELSLIWISEFVIASLCSGWIAALTFVPAYNYLNAKPLDRRSNDTRPQKDHTITIARYRASRPASGDAHGQEADERQGEEA
jgi:hypothetical protein